MTETKGNGLTVAELRDRLQQAAVDAAYWRGRAESLEGMLAQRSPSPTPSLPPELLSALLAAKLKEKQDAQESV